MLFLWRDCVIKIEGKLTQYALFDIPRYTYCHVWVRTIVCPGQLRCLVNSGCCNGELAQLQDSFNSRVSFVKWCMTSYAIFPYYLFEQKYGKGHHVLCKRLCILRKQFEWRLLLLLLSIFFSELLSQKNVLCYRNFYVTK